MNASKFIETVAAVSFSFRYLCLLFTLPATSAVVADEPEQFFESKIRPLLIRHCYECHSAEQEQNGGLLLDSKPGWAEGGDSGTAIVPGDPDASLLIQAVRWDDPALQMPPEDAGGKLSDEEIADLEAWVKSGAFDPRLELKTAPNHQSWEDVLAERRQWWSLEPVVDPPVPTVASPEWNASDMDRFLYDRMLKSGVRPAAVASPATLIRRATLVLTGLPPTVDEVARFIVDSESDATAAYAQLVDRLLDSPGFGERFARHWLDVVRYTETHGNEWNYDVPYAWRYRDYVIRAFNNDLPYDQFVREHIAGDLLPEPRWSPGGRSNESAIGTAFYRFGEVNHDSCVLFGVIGYDIADNQLDTLTKAFQATTVACARCHDHKLDAVSMRDYHALLGIIRSSRAVMRTLDAPHVNRDVMTRMQSLKSELRRELADVWWRNVESIDSDRLLTLMAADTEPPTEPTAALWAWHRLSEASAENPDEIPSDVAEIWSMLSDEHQQHLAACREFNSANFSLLADFRDGDLGGWTTDGMGLRNGASPAGDFTVAPEGEDAVGRILPRGLFTFDLSDRLNGSLRSPTLSRTHGKVSFQVIGGGHSLTRVVFNNCQLNYTNQHSIHHPEWSWVTVDFKEETEPLHPYAELLTFWDNPKFPDPLGTLGKDTENHREPYALHAENLRSSWGVRRIVAHDGGETPRDESAWLSRLFAGDAPESIHEAADLYAAIAANAVEAFASDSSTDDDVRWLNWLLASGLLSRRMDATPKLSELVAEYRDLESRLTPPTTMPGLADETDGFDQPLLIRGEHTRPGEEVHRRYLEVLQTSTNEDSRPAGGSGRRELSELIASDDNPLTARVIVNRIWQWIFGTGLVRTPDDFGHLGEQPSHPEMLDHLTTGFLREGWSMKTLIRELVLSRAFQSAGTPAPGSREQDPDNVYLSWYPSRRGEAEMIRDSILSVSGRLDEMRYGPSVHPYRETADNDKRLYVGPLDGAGRRSIYIKFQLMEPPRFLSAFDLPGGKVTQGRRDSTNVPTQSLAMLNDPFVLAMADHWSGVLIADESRTVSDRAAQMFQFALGRSPRTSELDRFTAAIGNIAEFHGVNETEILGSRPVWTDAAHLVFNFKEFIFIP